MVDEIESLEIRKAELRAVHLRAATIKHNAILATHTARVTEKRVLTEALTESFRGLQAKLVKRSKVAATPIATLTVRADVERLATLGKKVSCERAALTSLENQQAALIGHKILLGRRTEKTTDDINSLKAEFKEKIELAMLDEIIEGKAAKLQLQEPEGEVTLPSAPEPPSSNEVPFTPLLPPVQQELDRRPQHYTPEKDDAPPPPPEESFEKKIVSVTTAYMTRTGKEILVELTKQEGQQVDVVLRADQSKDFEILRGEKDSIEQELKRKGMGISQIRVERVVRF